MPSSPRDLRLLEAMAQEAAVSLQPSLLLKDAERESKREPDFVALKEWGEHQNPVPKPPGDGGHLSAVGHLTALQRRSDGGHRQG
jgi:hypothetical protein